MHRKNKKEEIDIEFTERQDASVVASRLRSYIEELRKAEGKEETEQQS